MDEANNDCDSLEFVEHTTLESMGDGLGEMQDVATPTSGTVSAPTRGRPLKKRTRHAGKHIQMRECRRSRLFPMQRFSNDRCGQSEGLS